MGKIIDKDEKGQGNCGFPPIPLQVIRTEDSQGVRPKLVDSAEDSYWDH